jgi:hypothetical protein
VERLLSVERLFSVERLLGLKRLERAQRTPELGHRRAAIAEQRLERARAVAVADQRKPEAAVRTLALREQLELDAVGPREAPRRHRDAAREHGLQHPDRRELLEQRRLERGKLSGILVRQHEILPRAQAVLKRIPRRRALPSDVFGPLDFAPFLRLASARALLTSTAARGDCPTGLGSGAQPARIGQSKTEHGGDSLGWRRDWLSARFRTASRHPQF